MRFLGLLFLIGFLCLSIVSEDERKIENFLSSTKWQSAGHAFADKNAAIYTFSEIKESDWNWGCFVNFGEDTFSGYYAAPCGNDCFVSTYGTYKFLSEKEIFVDVKTITRSGFCENSGADYVGFNARYSYSTNENSVTLVKVN